MDEAMVEVGELTPMLFRKAVSPAVTEDVLAPLTDSGGHGAGLQHAGDEVAGAGRARESPWCWTHRENQSVVNFSR